jgi:ATP-dependent DNA helicase RecG
MPLNLTQPSNLDELLAQGENASLEFKAWGIRPESLAREMTGLANHQGGTLLLGVSDEGGIEGIPDEVQGAEEWAVNVACGSITPPIEIGVRWYIDEAGKRILWIDVPKGRDKPYQTAGKYYLRVGSTTRQASQGELLRLFQAAGFFHYDGNRVANAGPNELNPSALENYFAAYQIDFATEPEEQRRRLLINTDILHEEGLPTVAGLLLFGIDPERRLPQSGISFAHFAGREIQSELIDKQLIKGNLGFQIDRALACIKNNLKNPSDIQGAQRIPLTRIPPDKVFRELIVNACVHRNYAIQGSKIRILIFTDRIEFISPGRLPNTVTLEKLAYGVSYAINPIIVKFMENLGYMDRLGRGLPMVVQEMNKLSGKVIFEEIGETFKVTLAF